MKYIDFKMLENSDVNIYGLLGMKQYWKNGGVYTYDASPRPDNGLMMVLCDCVHYCFSDGLKIDVPKNSIIYIPKDTYYSAKFDVSDEDEVSALLINFRLCNENLSELRIENTGKILYSDKTGEFKKLFTDIINCYSNTVKNTLVLKSKFYNMLNVLISYMYSDIYYSGEIASIYPAVKYIEENLNTAFSISELSKKCAMSDATFRRTFRQFINCSPVQYINSLKIKKAQQMLKIPEMSVNSICEQLNFYDVSYFYKTFKKATGMTPTQYRTKKDS